jgi:hypothetical protein
MGASTSHAVTKLRDRGIGRVASVALATLLAALPACASGMIQAGSWYGLDCTFETPNSIDVVDEGYGLHVRASTYTLDVVDGQLTLDGVDHGTVKAGDTLHVTRNGRLFVNGVQRVAGGAR